MMSEYMQRASEYVIEHARYANRVVPHPEPYQVRFPLASGHLLRAADTMDLVRKVARGMARRDRHPDPC